MTSTETLKRIANFKSRLVENNLNSIFTIAEETDYYLYVRLNQTNYSFTFSSLNTTDKPCYWHYVFLGTTRSVELERVLESESVPDEVKEKLLFHLDLFR